MLLQEMKRPSIKKNKKRLGKGEGSCTGKQAGKGHKGQKSRSGGNIPAWFEGGQMPIQRRLPKRGFRNFTKKQFRLLNLEKLVDIELEQIDVETMEKMGLINTSPNHKYIPVKVLADVTAEFKNKIIIKADAFSRKAVQMIEANGGKAEVM